MKALFNFNNDTDELIFGDSEGGSFAVFHITDGHGGEDKHFVNTNSIDNSYEDHYYVTTIHLPGY